MPAATLAEFTTYLPAVKLTVDGTAYTFPIWNLSVTFVPWTGGVGPAQKMFDGRIRQKIRGWHAAVTMDMNFSVINTDDHCNATTAFEAMYNFGSAIIDLDPIDNPGDRVLTLVLEDGSGMSMANFTGHIRNRRFNVGMITETVLATAAIPSWVAGDPTP
ncbi:MAG: hypothetical protein KAJ19_09610 [Gammaproteobacteria bacterium]|nr:hypothetical protein [Gammaproteobacteria bacterium]